MTFLSVILTRKDERDARKINDALDMWAHFFFWCVTACVKYISLFFFYNKLAHLSPIFRIYYTRINDRFSLFLKKLYKKLFDLCVSNSRIYNKKWKIYKHIFVVVLSLLLVDFNFSFKSLDIYLLSPRVCTQYIVIGIIDKWVKQEIFRIFFFSFARIAFILE